MMKIAASATKAELVELPGRKQTRRAIIKMFHKQMYALREKLNVRSSSYASMAALTIY